MKKVLYILLLCCSVSFSQNEDLRISKIRAQLEVLAVEIPGLTEQAKIEINVNNVTLANFILAVSNAHSVNINISSELNQISISNNNFSNVTVADLLVFLCKEYALTINFTGNILSIKKYIEPAKTPEKKTIPVSYKPTENTISIDAKNDELYDVFKRIMDESAKNLVFTPGMESKLMTSYIKNMPFDAAMDKLALSNHLLYERTKDGFYVFEDNSSSDKEGTTTSRKKSSLEYEVLDREHKLLDVNFTNTPIASIIRDIGTDLNINIFTATPLDRAGTTSFRAKSISFDAMLTKIFESQTDGFSMSNTNSQQASNNKKRTKNGNQLQASNMAPRLTYKKENNIYFFGTEDQLSVRKVEQIHLMHRSVELLSDPAGGNSRNRTVGSNSNYNSNNRSNISGSSFDNNFNSQSNRNSNLSNRNRSQINHNSSNNSSRGNLQTIEAIIPIEISEGLDIKTDYELNNLYVTGSSEKIERLKNFIHYIDKTVPVVLIEVMFVEVNKNNTIETGVTWGIGEEPTTTSGDVFPKTDLSLGAKTINSILDGFNSFSGLNLGKVVPNFFATIKAMENNGNLKIKSTPKLSTLNGHRATFSNGETSYYTVTQRNIYGTDNPQTSEITNYEPIDAEIGLTIKPLVSGDGHVTLDIFVIQSSFGARIAENAPPDIKSREFSSIIRVEDQDIVVLGGLEQNSRNDSGTGVPLLARIPVIKWLFSSRKREAANAKLTVFIKPTIIY
ncbi:general secretion pathway protein GspD [uncultured Algibacter sp.]|uniref:type II secretion system protein GspD n=1 Tax=uncultured Algibacter sp. TaxID=298659 RepID=UPI00262E61BB|nr:general secretion pathway protein GspD [uncultured Algibacter sp.]